MGDRPFVGTTVEQAGMPVAANHRRTGIPAYSTNCLRAMPPQQAIRVSCLFYHLQNTSGRSLIPLSTVENRLCGEYFQNLPLVLPFP